MAYQGQLRRFGAFFSGETVLSVPTLHSESTHFESLFVMFQTVEDTFRQSDASPKFCFDFSLCHFLQQNAVVLIGGLARLIETRGGFIQFRWDTLSHEVKRNLLKNGFLRTFDNGWGKVAEGNAVAYKEHGTPEAHEVLPYLENDFLGRGWMRLSPYLKAAVVGNLWELYANAAEHAKSSIGVFSCAQHYPRKQLLKLTVGDFGIGIPNKVRGFHQRPNLSASRSLRWALQPMSSTGGGGRGLGLATIKELVKVNKGRLEIFSNDGYCSIDRNGEIYAVRNTPFQGTIVNVTLVCDNLSYCFASEAGDALRKRNQPTR